jgi:hypothetical protein
MSLGSIYKGGNIVLTPYIGSNIVKKAYLGSQDLFPPYWYVNEYADWDASLTSKIEIEAGVPIKWYDRVSNVLLDGTDDANPTWVSSGLGSYFTTELNEYLTTTFSLPSSTSPYTFMLWVYPDSMSTEGIFQFGSGNTNTNLQIYTANNRFQWVVATGNTSRGGGDSTNIFSTNTWYQITMTFDGSNIKGYVNNALEDSSVLDTGFTYNLPTSSPLNLFYVNRASFPDYYGNTSRIASLRVWDYALDLQTVTEIFNFYKGRFGY